MRAHVHGVLLDPFDLAETKSVIDRLLETAHARGGEQESIDQLAVFLKGLAHEILNPLTSISGILQVLTQEEGEPKERAGRYKTMLQSVERIQKVLRELEYFVRARKPQRRRVDPAKVARGVADRLRGADPPLTVTLDAPETAPTILADRQLALARTSAPAAVATGRTGRDQRDAPRAASRSRSPASSRCRWATGPSSSSSPTRRPRERPPGNLAKPRRARHVRSQGARGERAGRRHPIPGEPAAPQTAGARTNPPAIVDPGRAAAVKPSAAAIHSGSRRSPGRAPGGGRINAEPGRSSVATEGG
jgi:hypothetical protein